VPSTTTGGGGQAILISAATFLLNLVDKWVYRLKPGVGEAHLRWFGLRRLSHKVATIVR
jgi:hypothetical protein